MHSKAIISIFLVYFLFFLSIKNIAAQELPNPSANVETIAANSYIIPMDNAKQSTIFNNFLFTSFEGFHIKAYGLVYKLLEEGITVKWVIKAGKQKDETDFTANAAKVFPQTATEAAQNHEFRASAFIIDVQENSTSALCNSSSSSANDNQRIEDIIQNYGNDIAVYQIADEIAVDVRYTLRIPPKIAILTDGGFEDVGIILFGAADVPYTTISNSDFLANPECNSFVFQPHIEVNQVDGNYVATIEQFVNGGGNFLAQCISIMAFENLGLYQTTAGFQDLEEDDDIFISNYIYMQNDLPIMQFDGDFSNYIWGSTGSFLFANNSTWKPTAYGSIQLDDNTSQKHVVSGADLNGALSGGNMYYCGGHSYEISFLGSGAGAPIVDSTFLQQIINAQRVILNAAFVPANINFACAGADICICEGESVTLGCSSSNSDISYTWTPATGLSCTDCPNPVANPTETTTYTITPSTGACGSESITVTVVEDNTTPQVQNVQQICSDDKQSFTVSFEVTGTTPDDYSITGNVGTFENGTFNSTPLNNGDSYSFQVNNSNGCGETVEGTFDCRCSIGASISGSETICIDSLTIVSLPIELTGSVAAWEIVYAIDGQAQTPVVTTSSPYLLETNTIGNYTLLSVDGEDCIGTVSGTATIQEVDCSPVCEGMVATAFSPNEDGINDHLMATFPNCNVQNIRFQVFTRWGKRLFETTDIDNEYWDGIFQNQTLNMGVYVWVLEYDLTAEGTTTREVQKGTVLLLR